ncbi:MAG: metallophosphoesterase family protein [Rubricoccaceae bacterium]
MTIGLVSDTHGYYHPALDDVLRGVDLILHAGDVGAVDVLDRLEALAPVRAVYGNIDGQDVRRRAPEHFRGTIGGVRLWMTHIGGHPGKPGGPPRWARGIGAALRAERPDVFVCGHSHILRAERVPALGGMLFVNPGAAGRQGFHTVKTCLRLHVAHGRTARLDVVHLDAPAGEASPLLPP